MPIRKVRRFVRENPRMALGVQVAMTVLAHNKIAAQGLQTKSAALASIAPIKIPKAIKDKAQKTLEQSKDVGEVTSAVWDVAEETAKQEAEAGGSEMVTPPMTHEQARLWLQSYNAGPYALLRNKGDVPYKETQNYAPRVMKYYKQDLSNTPYDDLIVKSAKKYGLDPQMIRAVMKTESDFNNKTVSHAGARGLMQVMPVVWKDISKRYGIEWDYATGVFEPEKNIEVACAYLAWLRYDFLPRHFAAFEPTKEVPVALIRDNAPPRKSPRLVTEVAQAADEEHKTAISQVKLVKKEKSVAEAKARPKPGASMTKPASSKSRAERGAKGEEQGG